MNVSDWLGFSVVGAFLIVAGAAADTGHWLTCLGAVAAFALIAKSAEGV